MTPDPRPCVKCGKPEWAGDHCTPSCVMLGGTAPHWSNLHPYQPPAEEPEWERVFTEAVTHDYVSMTNEIAVKAGDRWVLERRRHVHEFVPTCACGARKEAGKP